MAHTELQVDYNQLAPAYHQRYQNNRLEGVARSLLELIRETQASRVLEAGCGTGRWLESIAESKAKVMGLDLSTGMLAQAQQARRGQQLVCGRASELPFSPHSFDLVFCVYALHHFGDPAGFIAAAASSLKPGGCLAIIGQVPQDPANRWYVYDYFPETYHIDLERFPNWETVMTWMQSAGFGDLRLEVVEIIHDPKTGEAVLEDPFLQKTATSQLALLSDQAYQQGLDRIQQELARATRQGTRLTFQVDLRLDLLRGIRADGEKTR